MTSPGHRPWRRCAGCGKLRDRAELLRIAVDSDGMFVPDQALRMGGRGAYVCCDTGCLNRAVQRGQLARALKATPAENREAVLQRLSVALK